MRAMPDPEHAAGADGNTDLVVDPWDHPRRRELTWYDPVALGAAGRAMTGLEFLTAIRDGALPPPPIASLIGSRLGSVTEGEVEFLWTPHESTYNPLGVVHGGLMCTLLDSAAGCAVQSMLPAAKGYYTVEIKVSFIKALRADRGQVSAVGRALRVGRRIAFAEAHARDGSGELVAHATTSLAAAQE
jgi:uncharacterized protein (TIGR00369 family)